MNEYISHRRTTTRLPLYKIVELHFSSYSAAPYIRLQKYSENCLIVGGDFNAKIVQGNQGFKELFKYTKLLEMTTNDKRKDKKVQDLIELLNVDGMFVLN